MCYDNVGGGVRSKRAGTEAASSTMPRPSGGQKRIVENDAVE